MKMFIILSLLVLVGLIFIAYLLLFENNQTKEKYDIKTGPAESIAQDNKSTDLGYPPDPTQSPLREERLGTFQNREHVIEYRSYFDSDQVVFIQIRGNPIGNSELIYDAISGVEKICRINQKTLFNHADVEYIRALENETILIEKWKIQTDSENEYLVEYNFNPPKDWPYKVMIKVTSQKASRL